MKSNPVKSRIARTLEGWKLWLSVASLFHLFLATAIFVLGRSGLAPHTFDSNGIGQFANDGRMYIKEENKLADMLISEGPIRWFAEPSQLHVKVYSLSFMAFRPIFGVNILTIEPVNLFFYLAILVLVFRLGHTVSGRKAGLIAAAIVGLWPSFLLHTTQFIRDPLFISLMMGFMFILAKLLTRQYRWVRALITGMIGMAVAALLWITRLDIWLLLLGAVGLTMVFLLIEMAYERRLLIQNLVALLLVLLAITGTQIALSPPPQLTTAPEGFSPPPPGSTFWDTIAYRRHLFIFGYKQSSALIDADVEFTGGVSIVEYIPRAAQIGFLAPFPDKWFSSGVTTGFLGRALAGAEMFLTYLLYLGVLWQLLRSFSDIRKRAMLNVLLFLTAGAGVTAIGLVVANLGGLYRLRYAFWLLLAILGSAGLNAFLPELLKMFRLAKLESLATESPQPE